MTFLVALSIFVLDRLTKIVAVHNMSNGQSIEIYPKIFHFTLVLNNGTAFGLLKGQNAALAILTALAVLLMTVYILTHKDSNIFMTLALGLVLGGALGNLFDRIRFGCVVDFLDFRIWPVFNVADSAITIGMIIMAIILCTRFS